MTLLRLQRSYDEEVYSQLYKNIDGTKFEQKVTK
eukprot:CAMPEP_0184519058 /NCGR_PEP_ID=MMETSP0198_2-20121128/6419_1 /TAXON_ID=1112570 /ORGANISM="Thraustochytrium sp., Strain LLF1b" /LENGTH=33 /DNA_ID= /DNA_START= /DNA_END= /DNA_ORIENTATION=